MHRWQQLIRDLDLAPHPEGGFYRETFRSMASVDTPRGQRSASTAIYFLLPPDTFSAWHRVVSSDEAWHLYEGELDLHTLDANGPGVQRLTADNPQFVVPAGLWQAAKPVGYALCGCTVAPGFDFEDFEMPTRAELRELFPSYADAVDALTR
ncbi:MAG: cupin domain-containing protein [Proteobacteria bacterium]|nr:cupin domain-containing protein [Pseudomonadota bacterium]